MPLIVILFMSSQAGSAVETSIYRYIIRHSMRRQIMLTIMATASFPFLYAFYELPKLIVNGAIQAKSVTTFPTIRGRGFELDQIEFSMGHVCVHIPGTGDRQPGIQVHYQSSMPESPANACYGSLRFDLYGRVLRFPLPQFRKTSSSEIVTMVTAEVEPLGGFIGDAFKLPIFQGGYLVSSF